jgi:hypothetical protein
MDILTESAALTVVESE